jgi:hypothetical protein
MSDGNLQGKFISATYQNLIQLDNGRGSVGSAPNINNSNLEAIRLLDGTGKSQQGIMLEHNNSGGFFTRSISDDNTGAWRIQHRRLNGQEGINFSRILPNGNSVNARLFIKNTGSVWVGFNEGEIFTDQSNNNLYVRNGIRVSPSLGSNPPTQYIEMRANSIFPEIDVVNINKATFVDGGIKLNSEYPFRFNSYYGEGNGNNGNVKFFVRDNIIGDPSDTLKVSTADWHCCVVGFSLNRGRNEVNQVKCFSYMEGGKWAIVMRFNGDGTGLEEFSVSVMFIKKGIYSTEGNFNSAGDGGKNVLLTWTGNTPPPNA